MSLRTSLKNLISRDPNAPSPRETDLQAEPGAGQTRRAIVAGSLAAAVPLPALAAAAPAINPAEPHPDQALLDAEAE